MATYTKGLKSIEVHTRGGETITASDTVEQPIATQALAEFYAHNVMHILKDPKDFVPFHAVDYIEVTASSGQFDRSDPYCAEDGETVLVIWSGEAEGTATESGATYSVSGATFPSEASVGDTLTLTFSSGSDSNEVTSVEATVVEAGSVSDLPYVVINSDGTMTIVTADTEAPTLTEVSITLKSGSKVCDAKVCTAKTEC